MIELLAGLEQSAVGEFVRTSSLWTYPAINLLHIFGIAALFGGAAVIDLRLIGFWRHVPIAALADAATPVAAAGLATAIFAGVLLLAANATEYAGNPFLFGKFSAVAVGLVNAAWLNASPAWRARRERDPLPAEQRRLAVFGAVSLVSWTAAVAAGRLIAYW